MDALVLIPILLFSVVVHEISHGLTALKLGDPTARDLGRLTLNPIPHIDLMGSIVVPLVSYLTAGTVFIAWAKPVPVNPANFRNVRRDDILVSLVGPASNLLVALACAIVFISLTAIGMGAGLSESVSQTALGYVSDMMLVGITLNVYLAVFNLLPVPPLDGSHVVASLLPEHIGAQYRRIGFVGIIIVILLMRIDEVRSGVLAVVRSLLIPYQSLIELFL